jgi:hypothetical protein
MAKNDDLTGLKALQAELNAAVDEHANAVLHKREVEREETAARNRLDAAAKKLADARARHDAMLDKEMGANR